MSIKQEKFFHGEFYTEGPWNSVNYEHCRLCKTKSSEGRFKHWARGLCRSCYRRLSVPHRIYNDRWNVEHRAERKQRTRKAVGKKEYKYISPEAIEFDDKDVETLLDRYDWRCAYSGMPLQGFDYKRGDAFQLEYIIIDGKASLVPVSRSINCSKKSLQNPAELEAWARRIDIPYPFFYISVDEYES